MSPEGSGRVCVFCRRPGQKMSKEHLWPEWVLNLLPGGFANRNVTYKMDDSHLGRIREIQLPLFQLTVKDVCEDCNTGWMHQLEDATRPLTNICCLVGEKNSTWAARPLSARGPFSRSW